MVDLPTTPNTVPELRAPQSKVSPGQIAAPYQELAANLNKAGEVIEKDIAVPLAEQAGAEAGHKMVRAGPDGMPIVDSVPFTGILGPASTAYARAARMQAFAKLQPEMENKLTEMRLARPNDPTGFKTAADAFIEQTVANTADPLLHGPIRKAGADFAGSQYRSALVEADHNNLQTFLATSHARLTEINAKGASLAWQGGTETPEYIQLHENRIALYRERVNDPRAHYSRERAEIELKDNRDADVAQGGIGTIVREYKTKQNAGEAQKALQDFFLGPNSERLNLSMQKRLAGISEGLRQLEHTTIQDSAERTALRSTITTYGNRVRSEPNSYDDIAHNDLDAKADKIGDYQSKMMLDGIKRMQPLWQQTKGLAPQEASRVMGELSRGVVPPFSLSSETRSFFAARSNARIEGLNPTFADALRTAATDFETATGQKASFESLTRTTQEQSVLRWKYEHGVGGLAAPPGQSRHERGNAADIPDGPFRDWLHANAKNYPQLEFLKGQAFQADSGHVQLAGATTGPSAGPGLPPGQSVIGDRNPYMAKLFEQTVADMKTSQGHHAEQLAAQITKMAEAGDTITPDTIALFVTTAAGGGKEELLNKLKPILEAHDVRQQLSPTSSTAAALESEITAAKASGVDPARWQVLDELQKQVTKNTELWAKDPMAAGVHAGMIPPTGPLNVQDPKGFGAEIATRNARIGILRASPQGVGPISALTASEGQSVKTALTQGDPAVAGQLLGAMQATLSADNFRATLATDPMKQALDGMVRSKEPARMTAGMSTLDTLWRQNAIEFEKNHATSMDHLQTWQILRESHSQEEIAKLLNESNDPSVRQMRADGKKAAEEEINSWKPNEIAYQMGTSYSRLFPEFARHITGSTPDVPPTVMGVGNVADVMMHDFSEIYKTLRTYGAPPVSSSDTLLGHKNAMTMAMQRLGNKWQISAVAGNQIMAYPPDTVSTDKDTGERRGAYYPLILGSHDWMKDQLEEMVTAVKGPRRNDNPLEIFREGAARPTWTITGMISDPRTQAEISAGKPPSYHVVIDTGNGLNEILRDPKTGSDRITFDPTRYREKMGELLRNVEELDRTLARSRDEQGTFLKNVREAVPKPRGPAPTPAPSPTPDAEGEV